MNNTSQLIVALFGVLYIVFILSTRKKTSFLEYAVASRKIGPFLVFSSLAASMIGPAYTMGIVSESFNQGMFYYLSIGLVGFNYLIMTAFAKKIHRKFPKAITAGDIIGGESGHNSRLVKLVIGVLTFVHMTLICVMLTKSIGVVFLSVFGWSERVSIPITIGVVTAYSYFGGIRATIHTDVAQLLIFIIFIPCLIIAMVSIESFELGNYIESAKDRFAIQSSEFDFKQYFEAASAWFLLGMFGSATINRVLVSQDAATAKIAFGGTSFFMFIWMFVMVLIGDLGHFLNPDLQPSDGLLIQLASNYYGEIVFGIFVMAILGVIMSTHDTILNTASIILSEDILGSLNQHLSDESKLRYSKTAIIVIGLISIVGAQYIGSIIGMMISLISLVFPAYLPSIISSIILKRLFWQSSIVSVIVGLVSTLYWRTCFEESFVPPLIFGLACSSIMYGATNLYFKNRKRNHT